MGNLETLYCANCGGSHVEVQAWVDANTLEYVDEMGLDDAWCNDCREHTSLETLPDLWGHFSDVPVDQDDNIEIDFLCFEKGTPKLDVWHWFDDRCPNNLYDDLMINKND